MQRCACLLFIYKRDAIKVLKAVKKEEERLRGEPLFRKGSRSVFSCILLLYCRARGTLLQAGANLFLSQSAGIRNLREVELNLVSSCAGRCNIGAAGSQVLHVAAEVDVPAAVGAELEGAFLQLNRAGPYQEVCTRGEVRVGIPSARCCIADQGIAVTKCCFVSEVGDIDIEPVETGCCSIKVTCAAVVGELTLDTC